jgi:hypothetical protein
VIPMRHVAPSPQPGAARSGIAALAGRLLCAALTWVMPARTFRSFPLFDWYQP